MARVSAFQADCYGFESHRPLHFDPYVKLVFGVLGEEYLSES